MILRVLNWLLRLFKNLQPLIVKYWNICALSTLRKLVEKIRRQLRMRASAPKQIRGNETLDEVIIGRHDSSVLMLASEIPKSLLDRTVSLDIPSGEVQENKANPEASPSSSGGGDTSMDEKSLQKSETKRLYHVKKPYALEKAVEGLVAVSSVEYERYERNVKLPKEYIPSFIPPFKTTFLPPTPPNDWVACVHPEGMRYFFDDSRVPPVLTDAYLYDPTTHQQIEYFLGEINSYIASNEINLPSQTHLVVEMRNSGRCGYYFVNHNQQTLFWLDEFDITDQVDEVKVLHSESHIGLEIRSQYWNHNELFPHAYHLVAEDLNEIEDIIRFAIGDSLMSSRTTSAFSLDTLRSMLSLTADLQRHRLLESSSIVDPSAEQESLSLAPGASCVIFKFLSSFYHHRFLHLYGEKRCRLNLDQSIHPARRDTFLVKVISPFLLYFPKIHLRKLKRLTVDSLVSKVALDRYIDKVTDEWKEVTLYATVLLNANVAFLTIQSVDAGATFDRRSNAQRASYCSIVASMGTIIFGLMLVRQHKATMNVNFISHRSASGLGLETLALMYSLPYALLMWAMISFLAAFSISWYQSRDAVVIVLVSSAWVVFVLLLFWCISAAYENGPYYWPWPFRTFLGSNSSESVSSRVRRWTLVDRLRKRELNDLDDSNAEV